MTPHFSGTHPKVVCNQICWVPQGHASILRLGVGLQDLAIIANHLDSAFLGPHAQFTMGGEMWRLRDTDHFEAGAGLVQYACQFYSKYREYNLYTLQYMHVKVNEYEVTKKDRLRWTLWGSRL